MKRTPPKAAARKLVNVRYDETLHQQIVTAAKRSLRSVNSEIVFRLQSSLEQQSEQASA
jgi:predicted HicB family RNase H-like nuclease